MRADRPKQYLSLAGRTILEHTFDCFLDHPCLKGLAVSIAPGDPYWSALPHCDDNRILKADGGAERALSVLNALMLLSEQGAQADDWVLVHDAARPNLHRDDLNRLLASVSGDSVGGILAAPARDTLKRSTGNGRIAATVDRSMIWHALTPQMFRLGRLQSCLADALAAGIAVTDEASALEWAGHSPLLVEGRLDNLKITRPEDMEWLERRWTAVPPEDR
jgi:2-C-methyl-D-erythritol 4-phosphate cytidylyltransferase